MWSSDDQLLHLDVEKSKYLFIVIIHYSLFSWSAFSRYLFLTSRMISQLPYFYFIPSSQCLLAFSIIKHPPLKQIWPSVSEVITKIFISNRPPPLFICKIFICFYVKCKTVNFSKLQQTTSMKKFLILTKLCLITKNIKSQVIQIDWKLHLKMYFA